jgi:hypothetical protein
MVTLLFTAIAILVVLVLAVYFWQKPSVQSKLAGVEEYAALPPNKARGLFPDTANELVADSTNVQSRQQLLERALAGDNSAADEARKNFDPATYDEILAALVRHADSDAKLLSLLTHVTRAEMPVTKDLARAAIRAWENSPDRSSTARTLHITALADDARLYQSTVQSALKLFRSGSLNGVSAMELRALFDGEYWVLSNQTRSSGAGFILKLVLAKARRELEAAMRVS